MRAIILAALLAGCGGVADVRALLGGCPLAEVTATEENPGDVTLDVGRIDCHYWHDWVDWADSCLAGRITLEVLVGPCDPEAPSCVTQEDVYRHNSLAWAIAESVEATAPDERATRLGCWPNLD